ncbi:MAG TPA: alpha/beta hydrolase [Methyloversatilis sp.]
MSSGSRVVKVGDVDVLVDGEGAEAIVMVHGWPDTFRLWDAQVQHLKAHYRCVRFTLPGFAAGDARQAHTLDELTGLLDRVVVQCCPDGKAVLLLHDWGCVIGYEFCMRHPHRVSRVIGVDIGDTVSLRSAWTLRELAMVLAYQCWLALAWVVGGRPGDRMTRAMARALHCPSPQAAITARMTYPYFMYWFGGRQAWRRRVQYFVPSCPVLFIYGRRKPLMFHAPAWADSLIGKAGNDVVAFDAGHWVMTEQPERFNRVVAGWLRDVQTGCEAE